eukprot:CAMPEP_0115052452 /NCGR_PEP_ID=MMETSP0227-20121206/2949_1 /TAXON_ID=89957 /ORGANISM="Polarella glacialis, Strain CCMP 1383" /LENGTH=49 /DNA_ID=CAMNT_0002436623 /DNA_START=334 /DNA_END=483 /DNA_ORIENTATION=-
MLRSLMSTSSSSGGHASRGADATALRISATSASSGKSSFGRGNVICRQA